MIGKAEHVHINLTGQAREGKKDKTQQQAGYLKDLEFR